MNSWNVLNKNMCSQKMWFIRIIQLNSIRFNFDSELYLYNQRDLLREKR